MKFLSHLYGGEEIFWAQVNKILVDTNPYTDHTMRGIFGSFGPADTIMEFTDVDREGYGVLSEPFVYSKSHT